ncbi:YfiR family protein [Sanyastnella coralliicola]|uniref:YfiR family protein n=1 Tax=Sanyastnella coralliicola TaxID=3069118 RepID=UPI0027B9A228|nr:YfiR family protein [Longitalea sp. SCSIO 12813]
MKLFWLGMAALLSVWLQSPDQTDPQVEDDDTVAVFKASYLFKFATSNDWPEDAKTGPFKVGIFGNSSVYENFLNKFATHAVGSQVVEVEEITSANFDEFYHMIYVDRAMSSEFKKVISSVGDAPTLVVADDKSFINSGACISFVVVDNATKYIINSEAAQKKGITFGSTIILWSVSE